MKYITVILLSSFLFLLSFALLPLPIPPYLDFQVIYHADMGLLRGIPLYDRAGQVNMIAQLAHVPPGQVFVLPFPYPPWYALTTLWLVLLPIAVAARVWLGLNLLMLFASVWLMTDGWEGYKRLIAFPVALFFFPVIGSLFVGQYGFPILLGAALFGYALQNKKAGLIAIAAALLTFKPHLGLLILILGLIYLFFRRDEFGRRALIAIIVVGIFFFAVGFLASPRWPLDYFRSLTGFKDVSQCNKCNSIPMELASLMGGGLNQAIWFALILFFLMTGWLFWSRRALAAQPILLGAAGVIITLLVSPYLQNYDYLLLLVPLFILATDARRFDWLWLTVALVLPFTIVFFGSSASASLLLSTVTLFILLVRRLAQLDVSPFEA